MQSTFWKIWQYPLILGILSMFGLISALTGDALWDVLSWLTLFAPLAVIALFVWRKNK